MLGRHIYTICALWTYQFQNLIGMLGSLYSVPASVSFFCFKTLQVCQEGNIRIKKQPHKKVSKPYRYARKLYLQYQQQTSDLVSKPYRYARKAFKKILAELVLYVSKPYRYARKDCYSSKKNRRTNVSKPYRYARK